MNTIPFPAPDESSDRSLVAAEVRGFLAKRKIPTYKLAEALGGVESRGYWQRRVSGELALDIDDLSRLAELLGVSIVDFIPASKPRPTPDGALWAPRGSNPRPTDYRVSGSEVVSLADRRNAKALA